MEKLRAVQYNRVSTDELVQLDALQSQIKESEEAIAKMGWVLVDKYIDEGKSGTMTAKRRQYQRLYDDLFTNKFDVVVIKSQDRLMRNTLDWYKFVDALVRNNKQLYMYLENKFYSPEDALTTGIKAILAEEYSRDLSKKINNAHKRRQQLGQHAIITSSTWGYKNFNKQIFVDEEEANIVRLMFDLCIQGYGSRSIAKELANRGVFSRSGKMFAEVTVRKIIRNPLYKGDVVMNKSHYDFNSKKYINNPKEEWIIHENFVPAIVSKEIWDKANSIMDKRSAIVKSDVNAEIRRGVNKGKFDLSSKIICGMCGSTYWRRYRYVKSGQVVEWSCSKYMKSGRKTKKNKQGESAIKIVTNEGCDNRHLKNDDMYAILSHVADDIYNNKKEQIIKHANTILNEVLSDNNYIKMHQELVSQKEKYARQKNILMDKLLEELISDEDFKPRNNEITKKIYDIEQQLNEIEEQYIIANNISLRLEDIKKCFMTENLTTNVLVSNLVEHTEKIVVYEDYLEIYFDFLQNIKVGDVYTEETKYQFVDSSVYSVLQTDVYHTSKQTVDYTVKMYI